MDNRLSAWRKQKSLLHCLQTMTGFPRMTDLALPVDLFDRKRKLNQIKGQCYKTFFVRNLQFFTLS
jgi:hypothetical protein